LRSSASTPSSSGATSRADLDRFAPGRISPIESRRRKVIVRRPPFRVDVFDPQREHRRDPSVCREQHEISAQCSAELPR
jgi:hypothetical protein